MYVHAPAHEKATVVLLSPEQAVLRLPKFPLANNNSPKVPIEARLPATHPEQDVGVWERREAVYGYGALAKYNTAPVSNKSHRRGVNHGGWLGEEGRR